MQIRDHKTEDSERMSHPRAGPVGQRESSVMIHRKGGRVADIGRGEKGRVVKGISANTENKWPEDNRTGTLPTQPSVGRSQRGG